MLSTICQQYEQQHLVLGSSRAERVCLLCGVCEMVCECGVCVLWCVFMCVWCVWGLCVWVMCGVCVSVVYEPVVCGCVVCM